MLFAYNAKTYGDSKITTMVMGYQVLEIISGNIKTHYAFSKSFEVVIPEREKWYERRTPIP